MYIQGLGTKEVGFLNYIFVVASTSIDPVDTTKDGYITFDPDGSITFTSYSNPSDERTWSDKNKIGRIEYKVESLRDTYSFRFYDPVTPFSHYQLETPDFILYIHNIEDAQKMRWGFKTVRVDVRNERKYISQV